MRAISSTAFKMPNGKYSMVNPQPSRFGVCFVNDRACAFYAFFPISDALYKAYHSLDILGLPKIYPAGLFERCGQV